MKIAIIPNSDKQQAIEYAMEIIDFLSEYDSVFSVPREFSSKLVGDNITYYKTNRETTAHSDITIAIGGDATIIRAAKHAAELRKPILGVNFGRVGFVANLEPSDISLLSRLFSGDYIIDERMMLEVTVKNGDREITLGGLNDVTVSRGATSRMIELEVSLNGEFTNSYRADGLIVSTPTGSTAYSLAAGGPVLEPHMKCLMLTPICPHSLFSRSILIPDDYLAEIKPADGCEEEIFVTMDGTQSVRLEHGGYILVKKAAITANFIKLNNKNFYRIVSDKLNERRNQP